MTEETEFTRRFTADELCEAVFYLSRYAECLEIGKAITVPDERELLWMIIDWAKEFEQRFDPNGSRDHQTDLETQGTHWLMETFPYTPELDEDFATDAPVFGAGMVPPGM